MDFMRVDIGVLPTKISEHCQLYSTGDSSNMGQRRDDPFWCPDQIEFTKGIFFLIESILNASRMYTLVFQIMCIHKFNYLKLFAVYW